MDQEPDPTLDPTPFISDLRMQKIVLYPEADADPRIRTSVYRIREAQKHTGKK